MRADERVTWSGRHRAAARRSAASIRARCRTRCRSGSPSAARRSRSSRAGALGLPLRWRSSAACRSASPRSSTSTAAPPRRPATTRAPAMSINSHGFIAETTQARRTRPSAAYAAMMDRIGRERGWPPMSREQYFERCAHPRGALRRQPEEVAEKILFQHEIFGHDRFLVQMSVGTLPHATSCARSSCSRPRSPPLCGSSWTAAPRPDAPPAPRARPSRTARVVARSSHRQARVQQTRRGTPASRVQPWPSRPPWSTFGGCPEDVRRGPVFPNVAKRTPAVGRYSPLRGVGSFARTRN